MHLGEMVEKIKYAANNCKQNNFTQEVFIMKKIKFVIAIIGCFVVLNSLTISASAANIYVQTWRLIDAGGHLDWSDEGTKYLSQWKSAVNMWNDYKPGVIREDTGSTINDVEISDIFTVLHISVPILFLVFGQPLYSFICECSKSHTSKGMLKTNII